MTAQSIRIAATAVAWVVAASAPARAQLIISAAEGVNFKLGILGQLQADTLRTPRADTHANNLFARRLRLMFGGQVARKVTFFVETDTPNLGKALPAGKNITPGTLIQDAYGEFKASDALIIDAGLMFVPFSYNSLQSAASLLPIDYGAYTFTQSAPTQSSTGRDAGFQARGYLARKRVQYRIGVFQGMRTARSDNAFRYVGRIQLSPLEQDTGFFYTGTSLGKKKALSIGGAFDVQDHYRAYDVDAFADVPAGHGAFTGQLDFNRFDGDVTFTTLPKQNDVLAELGYMIPALKITPILALSNRDILDVTTGDEWRWSIGLNYWWAGHNANVKGAYSRISPKGAADQNEFTIQLQLFYF